MNFRATANGLSYNLKSFIDNEARLNISTEVYLTTSRYRVEVKLGICDRAVPRFAEIAFFKPDNPETEFE